MEAVVVRINDILHVYPKSFKNIKKVFRILTVSRWICNVRRQMLKISQFPSVVARNVIMFVLSNNVRVS